MSGRKRGGSGTVLFKHATERPIKRVRPRVVMVVLALAAAGCAHGGRPAGREIVWEGSVTVREDVVVAPGETLVIRPGTKVRFAFRDADGDGAGDSRITVLGAVRAVGTPAEPIEFAPDWESAAAGWTEILLEDGAGAQFSWCRFTGALHPVHSHRTPLVIEHCRFERNQIGVRFTGDPVTIRQSRFVGNGTAVRYWASSPRIVANGFEGNGTGVFVREASERTVISGNNFSSSEDYHVKLGEEQAADVEAPGNWWGSDRTEEIEPLLYDRLDAEYLGRVRYGTPAARPWRLELP